MEEGDQVTVGQCRPLSKTVRSEEDTWVACDGQAVDFLVLTLMPQVRFNVLRVLPRTGKAVKGFQKF